MYSYLSDCLTQINVSKIHISGEIVQQKTGTLKSKFIGRWSTQMQKEFQANQKKKITKAENTDAFFKAQVNCINKFIIRMMVPL